MVVAETGIKPDATCADAAPFAPNSRQDVNAIEDTA